MIEGMRGSGEKPQRAQRVRNFDVIEPPPEIPRKEQKKVVTRREVSEREPVEIQSSELEPIEPKPLEIESNELELLDEEPVIKLGGTRGKKLEPLEIPRDELEPLEREHQEKLKAINKEISTLLVAQKEQKEEFWSFLPGKKRIIAKLEQEIAELKTRSRLERMRIAEITNEYHLDVKKKRTKEALKPFFDAIKDSKKEEAEEDEDVDVSADVVDNMFFIRGLYKEKASLQAEREGWSLAFRPFRRREIDARLEEVTQEIKNLQEQVREERRAA